MPHRKYAMYYPKFIQSVNLPPIPDSIIAELPTDYSLYKRHSEYGTFARSDSFIEKVNQWCRENIANDIHFGFQLITGDVPIHIDNRVETKFIYYIEPGGNSVVTRWWSDDHKTLLYEKVVPCNQWFIFRADIPHSVENVEPGLTRVSLVGKIF